MFNYMSTINRLKVSLLFFIMIAVGGMMFLFNCKPIPEQVYIKLPQREIPQSLCQIKGLKWNKIQNGEKVLSIEAERFAVEKKKLGYYRFGLIHVAVLENAVLDLYLTNEAPADASKPLGDESQDLKIVLENTSAKESTFVGDGFSGLKDAFPMIAQYRISSITIAPICLNLRRESALVTQLMSKSATIRLKEHDILFSGSVRVVSGDKCLTTERLSFNPEKGAIETKRPFILQNADKRLEGNQITVDSFLNVVNDEMMKKPLHSGR